jgi:hypothetical protein
MAGLVPAIHVHRHLTQDVDARVEPGTASRESVVPLTYSFARCSIPSLIDASSASSQIPIRIPPFTWSWLSA